MAQVRLPRMLADIAGVERTFDVEAATAGDVVEALLELHPELRVHLFDESGWLRPNVLLFADGEGIRDRDQLERLVGPDGEVVILQSVAGGAANGGRQTMWAHRLRSRLMSRTTTVR